MPDNRFLSVSGIVIKENKVLLVRQTYGAAKGLLIIPGGYVSEGEMPDVALEREILEETGVIAITDNLIAVRFSRKDWWAIYTTNYVSGEPISDGNENSEVIFIDLESALIRDDLSLTTKEILKNYKSKNKLALSGFCPTGLELKDYQLYL